MHARYEHGSMIPTTNKSFGRRAEVLNDEAIATATLDRLLHHAHVYNLKGDSYRMKDRMKIGVVDPVESQEKRNSAPPTGTSIPLLTASPRLRLSDNPPQGHVRVQEQIHSSMTPNRSAISLGSVSKSSAIRIFPRSRPGTRAVEAFE